MEWFDLWCAALCNRPARLAMATRLCSAGEFLRQLVSDRQLPEAWGSVDLDGARQRVMHARRSFEQGVEQLRTRAPIDILPTRNDPRLQLGTDSPWVVVWGEWPQNQMALTAVVGTRRLATLPPGAMSMLQSVLRREDTELLSGGALGVDTTAHRCALTLGRPCVLVLAGGLLWAGPRSNTLDFQRILRSGGALVSSSPVQMRPGRWEFSERNRLIAALADHVILARAPSRSGARITCDWARKMRRPVLLLPWGPHDLCIEGCQEEQFLGSRVLTPELWASIKDATGMNEGDAGSLTVRQAQMLLDLQVAHTKPPDRRDAPMSLGQGRVCVPMECEAVWNIIRGSELTTDDIIGVSSDVPSVVLASLGTLELCGLARLDSRGRWLSVAE